MIGGYVNTNNRAHEEKKNVVILGDSIIKYLNAWDTAVKLKKCKLFVKRLLGTKVRCLKDRFFGI